MTLNFQIGTMCADTHGTTPERAAQLYKDTALGAVLPDRPISSPTNGRANAAAAVYTGKKARSARPTRSGPVRQDASKSSETPSECPYACT
jgi:hypothetical protein